MLVVASFSSAYLVSWPLFIIAPAVRVPEQSFHLDPVGRLLNAYEKQTRGQIRRFTLNYLLHMFLYFAHGLGLFRLIGLL